MGYQGAVEIESERRTSKREQAAQSNPSSATSGGNHNPMKGVSLVTRRIMLCAIAFEIFFISVPPGFTAQQANAPTNRVAKIRTLTQQLRWRKGGDLKHYEAIKDNVSQSLFRELDAYISQNFPADSTAAQVRAGLDEVLEVKNGDLIQNVVFSSDLPAGRFLIVGIELEGAGTNDLNEYGDRICFRAYQASGRRLVYVANSGNMSDSALTALHALPLRAPQVGGDSWFIAWADVPPQSPYTIAIRLYAFDGKKFRTVWAPPNIIAAGIDTAVQVEPGGALFTVNQMPTWTSQDIVHEQYAVSASGPKKIKEWETAR